MHEASIALSILDIIAGKCSAEGYRSVEAVRLRIGRAAGIMPEALLFTFDAAKCDTLARDAKLVIDIIPLGGFCIGCEREFEVEEAYVLNCPLCGSGAFRIEKGYEMEIVEMEVNE
ncbi:MAG TPA: hydrogenase maturation nickel metallochaperone HypA [Thermodesulfovibrionales bacterium]|nr:hydrogenase maturation nickel metallochaperone HypA [Thermodesulfovibrionales bacterium]